MSTARLIRISVAARLLGVDVETLRRRSNKGGEYLEIYGQSIRVFRMDIWPDAKRRFDTDEIARLLNRIRRA